MEHKKFGIRWRRIKGVEILLSDGILVAHILLGG
jgi:hypothetical protein